MIILADIITSILEPSLFGIPYLFIIIGMGVLFYFLFKPKKEDKFRKISLSKEVKREVNLLFDVSQENLEFGKVLMLGSNKLGYIYKMINFIWNKATPPLDRTKEEKTKEDMFKDTLGKQFYGLKVGKKGLINRLLSYVLGSGIKFYFVEKNLVSINPFEVVINSTAQYRNFINVIVFSQAGNEIIEDIAYKITLENTLDEMVNFVPKLTFLELKQAKFSGKLDKLTDIEDEKFKKRMETLESD